MATQASDSIRQKPRATTADELTVIVQRAQSFTNASGAAIAISEGNTDEIVCRARSGSSAPDVGTALRVEGTFTGVCIQSGKELRCDDAETDTRVDTSAIRALGIRSMVVTPIRDEGRVVGVLAVFAPTPHAFTITHVAVLKTMADQITTLLQKDRRLKDEPHIDPPAPPPALTPIPVAVPMAMPKPPVIPAVPLPAPVVIKPPVPSASPVATAIPARSHVPTMPTIQSHGPTIAKVEAVSLAADISAPVPFPRKEERREFKPEPAVKTNFGTLDAVAGEPARSSNGKMIVLGVLALIAAAAAAGWFYLKAHKSSSQQQTQNSAPAASAPATSVPAPAATNPVAASTTTTPAAPVNSLPSVPKADVPVKSESKKAESKKKEQQETPPAPATVSLGSGPSKITQQSVPQTQSADVAPSFAVGGGSSSGLASLARPVGASAPTMMTHSDLVNAKAIRTVPPVYPELAKARRISGAVEVKVTVGKDGKVNNPRFISGPIIFRDAAFDAVKQWVFRPAELNGQVIEQETDIRLSFRPN